MASNVKIGISQLASTIQETLTLYSKEINESVDKNSKKLAKEAANKLKSTSPKKKGKYAKDWKVREEVTTGQIKTQKIYNEKHYRLTHLLENGHAIRGGGRTKAMPHIKPIEQEVIRTFEDEVEKIIKGGG